MKEDQTKTNPSNSLFFQKSPPLELVDWAEKACSVLEILLPHYPFDTVSRIKGSQEVFLQSSELFDNAETCKNLNRKFSSITEDLFEIIKSGHPDGGYRMIVYKDKLPVGDKLDDKKVKKMELVSAYNYFRYSKCGNLKYLEFQPPYTRGCQEVRITGIIPYYLIDRSVIVVLSNDAVITLPSEKFEEIINLYYPKIPNEEKIIQKFCKYSPYETLVKALMDLTRIVLDPNKSYEWKTACLEDDEFPVYTAVRMLPSKPEGQKNYCKKWNAFFQENYFYVLPTKTSFSLMAVRPDMVNTLSQTVKELEKINEEKCLCVLQYRHAQADGKVFEIRLAPYEIDGKIFFNINGGISFMTSTTFKEIIENIYPTLPEFYQIKEIPPYPSYYYSSCSV